MALDADTLVPVVLSVREMIVLTSAALLGAYPPAAVGRLEAPVRAVVLRDIDDACRALRSAGVRGPGGIVPAIMSLVEQIPDRERMEGPC